MTAVQRTEAPSIQDKAQFLKDPPVVSVPEDIPVEINEETGAWTIYDSEGGVVARGVVGAGVTFADPEGTLTTVTPKDGGGYTSTTAAASAAVDETGAPIVATDSTLPTDPVEIVFV